MKKITALLYLLFIGTMLILFLGCDNNTTHNDPIEDVKKSKMQLQKDSIYNERKSTTVDASALYNAFKENELSADNKFKGKKIYVEGIIKSVERGYMGDIIIKFKAGGSVSCYILDREEDKVLTLEKGQKITVYGRCKGFRFGVSLSDCIITENLGDLK